ncbi:unnamed protein product [Allacma fusca]|uniref:Kazal-like domain-containing protein n=1 Tax=Allacma fusca TaxID=39272 RepID=A0A8J2PWW5_9HEXA|nr:unnamed protein product [Allacma fusca]
MLKSRILILGILGLVQLETTETLYVRYYVCDNGCPMDNCEDESEEEESKVCTHIIETDPDGSYITFPNRCAFDCANKCYEYQLTAIPGACKPNMVAGSSGTSKGGTLPGDKNKSNLGIVNKVDDDDEYYDDEE